jgi:hypothetical protein
VRARVGVALTAAAALTVGAVIGAGLAGATQDVRQTNGALVDERVGSYRGVRMGDGAAKVRRRFGPPGPGDGIAPLGDRFSEIGGPAVVPAPTGSHRPPRVMRYDDVTFILGRKGVYAFLVVEQDARTRRGVAVGDPLLVARAAYRLRCAAVIGSELPTGGYERYPSCRGTLRSRIRIWFGRDPIRSITLLSLPHLG